MRVVARIDQDTLRFRDYARLWLKKAIFGPFARARAISFVSTLAIGLFGIVRPDLLPGAPTLALLAAAGILLVLVVVGAVRAPFLLRLETERDHASKQAAIELRAMAAEEQLRRIVEARPTFAFRVIADVQPTAMPAKRLDEAKWLRIEVTNTATGVVAEDCSIEVESIEPPLQRFVRGPLPVTHHGDSRCQIPAKRRESFDICWCFETHATPDAYFCLPNRPEFNPTHHARKLRVAFSAKGLVEPITGEYDIAWHGDRIEAYEGRGLGVGESAVRPIF
jgi:hypothetical protein